MRALRITLFVFLILSVGFMKSGAQKTSFPEAVGMTGPAAKTLIESEVPGYQVVVVPYGAMVTTDWNEQRVRIYVNEQGVVEDAPRIG